MEKGKVGDILNKPAKRMSVEKFCTPPCLLVRCDEGELYFVLEDIESVRVGLSSVQVAMGTYTAAFTWSA